VAGATVLLSGGSTISHLPTRFTGLSVTNVFGIPGACTRCHRALRGRATRAQPDDLGPADHAVRREPSDIARHRHPSCPHRGIGLRRRRRVLRVRRRRDDREPVRCQCQHGQRAFCSTSSAVSCSVGRACSAGGGASRELASGVLLLGFLANGMSLIGLASYDQVTVTGLVILGRPAGRVAAPKPRLRQGPSPNRTPRSADARSRETVPPTKRDRVRAGLWSGWTVQLRRPSRDPSRECSSVRFCAATRSLHRGCVPHPAPRQLG